MIFAEFKDFIISDLDYNTECFHSIIIPFENLSLNLDSISEKLMIETLWFNPNYYCLEQMLIECNNFISFFLYYHSLSSNLIDKFDFTKTEIIKISFKNKDFLLENFKEIYLKKQINCF